HAVKIAVHHDLVRAPWVALPTYEGDAFAQGLRSQVDDGGTLQCRLAALSGIRRAIDPRRVGDHVPRHAHDLNRTRELFDLARSVSGEPWVVSLNARLDSAPAIICHTGALRSLRARRVRHIRGSYKNESDSQEHTSHVRTPLLRGGCTKYCERL